MNLKIKNSTDQSNKPYQLLIANQIDQYLLNARTQVSDKNYDQAIKIYLKILFLNKGISYDFAFIYLSEFINIQYYELTKDNFDACKELATLYSNIGDVCGAIILYQRALQIQFDLNIEEKLQQLILLKGLSLMEQGEWNNFLEGSEHENLGIYLQYYSQDVNNLNREFQEDKSFIKYFINAHCYALTNYLVYALQEIEKALKYNAACIEVFLFRGKLLWALNKIPEGNHEYWRAHKIDSKNREVVEFMNNIIPKTNQIIQEIKLLIVQDSVDKCFLQIKKGLELYPDNTELLLMKSYLHRQGGDFEQALKDLDVCSHVFNDKQQEERINNQIALTYNEMAMFLFKKQKYDDSLTLFNEGLFKNQIINKIYKPNDWGMLVNRGDSKKQLGLIDDSIVDFEQALILSNNRPEVVQRLTNSLFTQAINKYNNRDYENALKIFNRCLDLSPYIADIMFRRGKCYLEMKRYQEALFDFKNTIKYDPKNFEATNYVKSMETQIQPKRQNIIKIENY